MSVRINRLGQLGSVPRFFTNEGDAVAGDRLGDAVPRKEPGLQLIDVRDCNRNQPRLQSTHFWDRIICLYLSPQDRIICF